MYLFQKKKSQRSGKVTDQVGCLLSNVMEEAIGRDKESAQKHLDLTSLNRMVFDHRIRAEILVK